MVQSRAPGIKAWIRRRSRDLSVFQTAVLKPKDAIADSGCKENSSY